MIESLLNWIQGLPTAIRQRHPRLSYLLGVCQLHRRDVAAAARQLHEALAGFETADDATGRGETLAYLVTVAFLRADFQEGLGLIGRALACPNDDATRVHLLLERVRVLMFRGAYAEAARDLDEVWSLCQREPRAETLHALLTNYVHGYAALPGELDRLERICNRAAGLAEERGGLFQLALDQQWALVHTYRGQWDAALRAAESAITLAERLGGLPPWPYWTLHMNVLRIQAARAARPPLDRFIEQALEQREMQPVAMAGFLYSLAHLCCMQDRLHDAERLLERLRSAPPPGTPMYLLWQLSLQGMIALGMHRSETAIRALREAATVEERLPLFSFLGSARVLLAEAYLAAGRPDVALVEMDRALAECERQGAPGRVLSEGQPAVPVLRLAAARGVHAELAARLLDTLAVRPGPEDTLPQSVWVPETGESLTAREVQVLQLVASGASNRAIAERLVITERTVKNHVTNILAKLGCSSRTQAAARARELHLA